MTHQLILILILLQLFTPFSLKNGSQNISPPFLCHLVKLVRNTTATSPKHFHRLRLVAAVNPFIWLSLICCTCFLSLSPICKWSGRRFSAELEPWIHVEPSAAATASCPVAHFHEQWMGSKGFHSRREPCWSPSRRAWVNQNRPHAETVKV